MKKDIKQLANYLNKVKPKDCLIKIKFDNNGDIIGISKAKDEKIEINNLKE